MIGPGGKVQYRELRRADLPSFEHVIRQAFGRFEEVTGSGQTVSRELASLRKLPVWTLVRFLQAIRIANMRILVGTEGQPVIGTAVLVSYAKTGYIGGVATDAAARGRGVATGLMEYARSLAGAQGRRWLALDVESENAAAIRLYRRIGYQDVARFNWFVGPPPASGPASGVVATEVPFKDRATVDWANAALPEAIRGPLPARVSGLTHLEFIARPQKSQRKMWRLADGARIVGVVRGIYGPRVRLGFVFPIVADATVSPASLQALVGPVMEWHRTLGATKIVVAVPESAIDWEGAVAPLGLSLGVRTTLMVRPVATTGDPSA